MENLRVLIADDHGLVRRGARDLLNSRRGFRVVGEAANGPDAVAKAVALKPDVAVIDISMPDLDGVEVARQIREAVPDTKVLILTMHESTQMVRRALEAGARGYLLKSDLTDSLIKAVKAVAQDKRFLAPKVCEIVVDGFLVAGDPHRQGDRAGTQMSPREIEIIRLLAENKMNKEIAALLGISVRTVETHRSKIALKLGLHSRSEFIHYAIEHGLARGI